MIATKTIFHGLTVQKVVRHLVREASKAGFRLVEVASNKGLTQHSPLDEAFFPALGDGVVVLTFKFPKQSFCEKVWVDAKRGPTMDCITYLGFGRAFKTVLADVGAYCSPTVAPH